MATTDIFLYSSGSNVSDIVLRDGTVNSSTFGKVNISGTWKVINAAYVNVGGVWKSVVAIFVNVSGTWKQIS